jgi:Bifunctional DNA primase/polymerase, N-terminal
VEGIAMIKAALQYAALGLPVFPLAPRTNVPMKGSHGYKDATTDPARIREAWRAAPMANVAVATGAGRLVVDTDPRNGGDDSLDELVEQHGELPETWQAQTPRRGSHRWFGYPSDLQVRTTEIAPGVDVKAEGGHVAVPPSRRRDGGYIWLAGQEPSDLPMAPAPAWLLSALEQRRAKQQDAKRRPYDGPPTITRLKPIIDGCAWLRHTYNDRATLSEGEWYGMLGIVGRTVEGERAAQAFSQGYVPRKGRPGYSAERTSKKLAHALASAGPYTCARIATITQNEWCRGCVGRINGIRSPIILGTEVEVHDGR